MQIFSYTGKGLRKTNEDFIKSEMLFDSISLHIVADGMGGYDYGEVASKTATEAIFQFFAEKKIEGDIPELIKNAVEFANSQIFTIRNHYHTKLGTTIAGVVIIGTIAYTFWLGDVQIQHFRDNKEIFISESHTLINDMKQNGSVSSKEIERFQHVVTKSISGNKIIDTISIQKLKILPQDVLIISTDGFYNFVKNDNVSLESSINIEQFIQNNCSIFSDNASFIKILI